MILTSLFVFLIFHAYPVQSDDKPFAKNALSLVFDRQNRTYFRGEDIKVKAVFDYKKGDPAVDQIILTHAPTFLTIKLHCWKECRLEKVNEYNPFMSQHKIPGSDVKIGKNEFEVSRQVGKQYPCSFEGPYGHVRYTINATVYTSEKPQRVQEFYSDVFYVINGADLSQDASFEKPLSSVQISEIGGKPLGVKVSIPKNGWVFPETIPVTASLENPTSWVLKKINAEVIMSQNTTTHRTALGFAKIQDTFTKNFTVASGNFENTKNEASKSVTVQVLHKEKPFPLSFPITVTRFISIEHFVKVTVLLSNPKSSDALDLPIELTYEFPVTFGIQPTKSTGLSRPDKFIPAFLGYQNQTESVVSYPSFEKLRKKH